MKTNFEFVGGSGKGFMSSDLFVLLISFLTSCLLGYIFFSDHNSKKPSKPVAEIKYSDIIGLESAKQALKEVAEFMMNP